MVAGIDIGKGDNYVSIDQNVKKFPIENLENMIEYLKEKKVNKVILEPTGVYSIPIIKKIYKHNFDVYIVPTYLISKFRGSKTTKNDIQDAKSLERYYYTEEKQFTKHIVDEKYIIAKQLNIMISEFENLKKNKTREINRLRGDLYISDINTHNLTEAKLIKYALNSNDIISNLRAERIKNIKKSIKNLEIKIKEYVENNDFLKRQIDIFMSIPAFSFLDACMIVSKIVDVKKFDNVKKFKKFLGFGVNQEESGSSIKRTKKIISHRVIKSKFYLLCLRNLQFRGDKSIKTAIYFYRNKYNNFFKAVMKVASRIITRLYYCLKTNTKYNKEIVYIDNRTLFYFYKMLEFENSKITDKKSKKSKNNLKMLEFLEKEHYYYLN